MPTQFEKETLNAHKVEREARRDINDISLQLALSKAPKWDLTIARLGVGNFSDRTLTSDVNAFGLGSGSAVGTLTIKANCHISGVDLRYVDIRSGKSVFTNCVFRAGSGVSDDQYYISLAAGAQAVFVGCTFKDGITAAYVADNGGVAADLNFVGCVNLSGLTLAAASTSVGSI